MSVLGLMAKEKRSRPIWAVRFLYLSSAEVFERFRWIFFGFLPLTMFGILIL